LFLLFEPLVFFEEFLRQIDAQIIILDWC